MDNYLKVKTAVETQNCTMITTFEEFEKKRDIVKNKSYHYVRIDFIGICGHNTSAVVTNFICRQTGIRCKECVKKNTNNMLKSKLNETNQIENNSINIIEKYLSDKYEITRTKEGCRADLVIKKKGDDKYIPIQVKSTASISPHKMYSFRYLNKDYTNMIILCISISEQKIWIIPYEDIKHLAYLNISARSKYNKYLIEDNNFLPEYIEKYADKCYTTDIDKLMTPSSPLQRQEQEYVKKRESLVNFLEYKYPEVQNTPTDFIVNGKKVQEKVCGHPKKNRLTIWMASNNGKKENGNRNFRTYRLGENQYYWFHSNIDNKFWIIPENILFEKGYISKADETKNKKCLIISISPTSNSWINDYKYDYDNINKDRILELFK
jgi:hypothetical protein